MSKQPLFKAGAVSVVKVADADGPAAPTNTASAPVEPSGPSTHGGTRADAESTLR